MEIINLGQADGLPPVDWAAVAERLEAGPAPAAGAADARTKWLSTVNQDGSARDPRCSIAVPVRDADVVVEGDAVRVTEPGGLARIAKARADQGWPAGPDDSGRGITAPFQRTVARTTAAERVPHGATLGDRNPGGRAGRPDPLPVLTLTDRQAPSTDSSPLAVSRSRLS